MEFNLCLVNYFCVNMYWSLRCIKHFALSVISVFVSLLFPKLTAGTPSKGLSSTLNYSVPGRGISGLLRGWFFPLFSTVFIGAFFLVLFVSRRPVQEASL